MSRLVTISRGECAVLDFFHLPSVGLAREVMVPAAGTGVGWRWRSSLYLGRRSFTGRLGSYRCQEIGDAA